MRGSWREHSGHGEDVYLHVHEGAAGGFERLALRARTREPWLQLCGWLALAAAAWLLALRLASPASAADASDALRNRLQEGPVPAARPHLPTQLAMSSGAEAVSPLGTGASADPLGSAGADGADGWVAPSGSTAPDTPPAVPGLPDPDPLSLDSGDEEPSIVIDDENVPVEPPAVLHLPVSEESPALEPESDTDENAEALPTTAPPSPASGLAADPPEL